MTREEYHLFKNEVHTKTTGANIYYINGKLGLIINSIAILELADDQETIDKYTQMIPKCITEINKKLNENRTI